MGPLVTIDQEAMREQFKRRLEPKYATRLFQLSDIPSVMRSKMAWPVAAALMERWFRGTGFEMPQSMKRSRKPHRLSELASVHLDETTVTMRWAVGYARVQVAVAELRAKWASPAGVQLLKDRIDKQGAHPVGQRWRFGDLTRPAKILEDTCQVNYLVFGQMSDPMDDFYGAMGESQLNIAVSGMVTSEGSGKMSIAIDELGFYLRDSYDFNDSGSFFSQPLGCWGFTGVQCGISTRRNVNIEAVEVDEKPEDVQGHKYLVQNEDFRRWRSKNSKGGDFMVLSDVLRVRLPFPLTLSW